MATISSRIETKMAAYPQKNMAKMIPANKPRISPVPSDTIYPAVEQATIITSAISPFKSPNSLASNLFNVRPLLYWYTD